MGTTLSDIIVPELFNPYVIQKTLEKSALVQSGIVQNDAEFDKLASQASPLVNMPFFSDLTGESETVIEGDDLTADKISSKKDVAVILRRAKCGVRQTFPPQCRVLTLWRRLQVLYPIFG